jgi:hypothetical protein
LDQQNHPQANIADAKRYGTYRGTVNCSISKIEFSQSVIQLNECWLEQTLFMDFACSPWRDLEAMYLCFTTTTKFEDIEEIEVRSNECAFLQRAWFCVGKKDAVGRTYNFQLTEAEVSRTRLAAEFSVNEESEVRHVIFSWETVPHDDFFLSIKILFYWPYAILVYIVVLLPILVTSAFVRSIAADEIPSEMQWKLYKQRPKIIVKP